MRALIMAGGAGSRLNRGEKPLIPICGQPMIAHVIHAFELAGCEPVVAGSPQTPMTMNWCRANRIPVCMTAGNGYVDDMVSAVRLLEEVDPLFISVSDIPCVTAEIIRSVSEVYQVSGKDALSLWVPADLVVACRGSMPYREQIEGIEACPAGINILIGDRIGEDQDECRLLLHEPRLALNVNTPPDRDRAEEFLRQITSG